MESNNLPNPYSTPAANLYGAASSGGVDAVSPGTLAVLAGTKPWVRFMSVILWLCIGFMLLIAAVIGIVGSMGGPVESAIKQSGAFGGMPLIVLSIMYGLMSLLYVYPAVKLWAFANRIGSLASTRSVADLDAALNQQRQFWKYFGILIIVMICGYLIAAIGLAAFVGTTAMKAGAIPR